MQTCQQVIRSLNAMVSMPHVLQSKGRILILSQAPLALGGQVLLQDTPDAKSIGIEQIQLEQVRLQYQTPFPGHRSFSLRIRQNPLSMHAMLQQPLT
jgi:hypothetical protein